MFTADAAVEDLDEIAQDSPCMVADSQETFYMVVVFRKNTTAPAVGPSRVPQKTTKTTLHILLCTKCSFLARRHFLLFRARVFLVLSVAGYAGGPREHCGESVGPGRSP